MIEVNQYVGQYKIAIEFCVVVPFIRRLAVAIAFCQDPLLNYVNPLTGELQAIYGDLINNFGF